MPRGAFPTLVLRIPLQGSSDFLWDLSFWETESLRACSSREKQAWAWLLDAEEGLKLGERLLAVRMELVQALACPLGRTELGQSQNSSRKNEPGRSGRQLGPIGGPKVSAQESRYSSGCMEGGRGHSGRIQRKHLREKGRVTKW